MVLFKKIKNFFIENHNAFIEEGLLDTEIFAYTNPKVYVDEMPSRAHVAFWYVMNWCLLVGSFLFATVVRWGLWCIALYILYRSFPIRLFLTLLVLFACIWFGLWLVYKDTKKMYKQIKEKRR